MVLQTARSKIGDAEIVQIVEAEIGYIMPFLLTDATPENIKGISWLGAPHVNDDGSMNSISQCFIVRKGKRLFIVDTCIGNEKDIAAFPTLNDLHLDFLETLESAGVDRMAVTDVLCTHLHFDHVGWNTYKKDGKWLPTFPNAKYHLSRTEFEFWRQAEEDGRKSGVQPLTLDEAQGVSLHESILPIQAAGLMNLIETPADLGDGFSVIPTPGHSHSHVSVVIDAGTQTIVLAGDAMHHPCQVARPHWAVVQDFDQSSSTETRKKLLARFANTGAWVTGTHFALPSFGTISDDGSGEYVFKDKTRE